MPAGWRTASASQMRRKLSDPQPGARTDWDAGGVMPGVRVSCTSFYEVLESLEITAHFARFADAIVAAAWLHWSLHKYQRQRCIGFLKIKRGVSCICAMDRYSKYAIVTLRGPSTI